jgi:hypothetical protein
MITKLDKFLAEKAKAAQRAKAVNERKSLKRNNRINESTDFVLQYADELKEAVKQLRAIAELLQKSDDDTRTKIYTIIDIACQPYDANIPHMFDERLQKINADLIVDYGTRNYNMHGTEKQMAIFAVNDVYGALVSKNLIKDAGPVQEAKTDTNVYTIECESSGSFGRGEPRYYYQTGTLEELINAYGYTLETGKSYEREKGNKKIDMNPKSVKALVDNLNKAVNNSAANGYSGKSYSILPEGEAKKGRHAAKTDAVQEGILDNIKDTLKGIKKVDLSKYVPSTEAKKFLTDNLDKSFYYSYFTKDNAMDKDTASKAIMAMFDAAGKATPLLNKFKIEYNAPVLTIDPNPKGLFKALISGASGNTATS